MCTHAQFFLYTHAITDQLAYTFAIHAGSQVTVVAENEGKEQKVYTIKNHDIIIGITYCTLDDYLIGEG